MTTATPRRTLSLLPLALLALAAPAFAGGIYLEVTAQAKPLPGGAVDVTVHMQRAEVDCFATVFVQPAADGVGPAFTLERREGKVWAPVQVAWRQRMKPEESVGGAPKVQRPFRLDWGCGLSVRRTAQLAPGTYRVVVSVSPDEADSGWAMPRTSRPFTIPSPSQPK